MSEREIVGTIGWLLRVVLFKGGGGFRGRGVVRVRTDDEKHVSAYIPMYIDMYISIYVYIYICIYIVPRQWHKVQRVRECPRCARLDAAHGDGDGEW